jgi:hypothetical protein
VDNPDFIPQRGFYTSPPVVDTFSDAPPFLRLERRDDNGAITNRDIPVTTGPPPTIATRNPPQQVHCQNELVNSIPERPTHASVMSNERWGIYQQPDDATNVPMHLHVLRQLPVCSKPRAQHFGNVEQHLSACGTTYDEEEQGNIAPTHNKRFVCQESAHPMVMDGRVHDFTPNYQLHLHGHGRRSQDLYFHMG